MRHSLVATAVLAYLAAVAWLHPQALSFDSLSFLMAARAGAVDYGHALYLPLLRAAEALSPEAIPLERSARIVSAVGGALAFALLWRRAARSGASFARAGLVAACFATATLVWQEAGSVEPTTWTVSALLVAAEASEAYGRRPTLARLLAAAAAFAVALGFHVVSVCALPWLASLARAERRPLPRAHAAWLAGVAALLALAAVLAGGLGAHWRYWTAFLPRFEAGVAAELAEHVRRGARLFREGAPVLVAAAVASALALAWRAPARLREAAVLGGPYALAFLALGKPLVGLLFPVLVAAALPVARAAGRPGEAPAGRARLVDLALAAAVSLQLALTLPQALAWRREPDEGRARAELFARHVPPGAVVFAGPLGLHFRYYRPELEVVVLPELWHRALGEDRRADPLAVVRRAVEAAGKPCVLTSEGAGFLAGPLGADVARLGLSAEAALFLPEDPRLALFPLAPPAEHAPR